MIHAINEVEVSYRHEIPATFWKKINTAGDAAEVLYNHWNPNTIGLNECFKVLLLNNAHKAKGIYQISQGGITGTLIDIRILFAVILKTLAVSAIICHNHPSGVLKPSATDKDITKKIQEASKLFDIRILDHIILAPNGSYYSFSESGML
ncbi:JAB domain-containing protein [Arenibacter lacus]|uniref:JAB domain-containing protein n=1 Tax=Arenibacter lacus TaxID=2608629 RepID=UPI00123D23B7|nr:JAB domain-containing protein [Arenibacter lacus]